MDDRILASPPPAGTLLSPVGPTTSRGPSALSALSTPRSALRDDGTVDPAYAHGLSDELAIALYEHMVLARTLDVRLGALQRDGTIAQHSGALGEEAAVIGASAAMRDEDWIFPSSRDAAAALWRGMPLAAYANHVYGTSRDAGRGRNAPDAPFWNAARVASVSSLSGTHIPHAVGVAWAARLRKEEVATLVFFGDGATSTGDFHTGMNFAGVTRAPVIAVCRNNGLSISTPVVKQTASAGLAIKAVAYGLQGVRVDGTDVVAVFAVVREARQRAIAGDGGTFIEAIIPGNETADPIARMRAHLAYRGLVGTESDTRLAAEVAGDVERALTEAAATRRLARDTLFDDVYAESPPYLVEQKGSL